MNSLVSNAKGTSSKWTNTRGISQHTGLSPDWYNKDRLTRLVGVPFVKIGKRVLYNIEEVDAFLNARMVRPDSEVR